MRTLIPFAAATFLSLTACQGLSDDGLVSVEDNDLGITQLEISHRDQEGDRLLVIRGLDEGGDEIAVTTLRTGMVFYSAEPEIVPEAWHAGTELMVSAGGSQMQNVTPSRVPHAIDEPTQPALAGFVRLQAVAAEIQREAGIRFTSREELGQDGEVAFSAGTCTGSRFPNTVGNPKQCCEDGTSTWHKIGYNPNNPAAEDKLAYRTYLANGASCRDANGDTGCTTNCSYGPCGAQNQTVTATLNTTSAVVYIPTGQPTVCGADSNGTATGAASVNASTELYTSQTPYAGVTATCPYTACDVSGAAGVTVSVTVSISSSVSSACVWVGSDSCCAYSGVSQTCQIFEPLNATPSVSTYGSAGWYGWFGDCWGLGGCSLTMSEPRSITAVYCGDDDACGA